VLAAAELELHGARGRGEHFADATPRAQVSCFLNIVFRFDK
jgi:hypothetical protein